MASEETSAPTQSSSSDTNIVSSWTDYFDQIATFLISCGRQYGLANESYSEYVIERLSVTLQGVNAISTLIRRADNPTLREKESSLTELVADLEICLRVWREYLDGLGTPSGNEYTPSLHSSTGGAGRLDLILVRNSYFTSALCHLLGLVSVECC